MSGTESYPLFVEFTDDKFLDATSMSLQQDVILVQGPNYRRFAKYSDLIPSHNATGTVVLLQYVIAPPKGGWTAKNAGTYKVSVVGDQISDSDGNTMPRTKIGTIQVTGVAPVAPTLPNIKGTYVGSWRQSHDLDGDGGVLPAGTGGPMKGTPPVAGKLTITKQVGNRIYGDFYRSGSPIKVHGVLYANGKFTLVVDEPSLDRHLRITGKLIGRRMIGYASQHTAGVYDAAGPFDFTR